MKKLLILLLVLMLAGCEMCFAATQEQGGDYTTSATVYGKDSSGTIHVIRTNPSGQPEVAIVSGGGGGEQYVDETAVDAAYKGNIVLGTDGIKYYILKVNASGQLLAAQAGTWDIGTITSITNAVTVTATDLDIRDLTSVSDSVSAVQSGTWNIGTLGTITNVVHIDDNASTISIDDGGGSVTVDGTFWQATQPVSGTVTANAGTGDFNVSLQDGAGTDLTSTLVGADQALDVNLVQSVAVPVTDNGGSLTVDGTFWQATQPISAASLPLPTGAATEAKQPALGTAGTPSSDVITVQGITNMTALTVDGSGVTQPISAASLPLPSNAAQETGGNLATLAGKDFATETTLSTLNGKVTACDTGAVTISSALPAGTNNIGDVDVLTLPAITIAAAQTLDTVTTVGTITNVVHVDDNAGSLTVDNATLSVTGGGTEAGALRVTIASDSTGVVSVDDNGSSLSIDDNGGSITVDGTVSTTAQNIGTAAPTPYNVTMTNADTEYSQALTNVKSLMFQCRGDYDIRYAFVTGKVATPTAPWMTLKAGKTYSEEFLDGAVDFTVYFACGTAGQVVEIEVK